MLLNAARYNTALSFALKDVRSRGRRLLNVVFLNERGRQRKWEGDVLVGWALMINGQSHCESVICLNFLTWHLPLCELVSTVFSLLLVQTALHIIITFLT
jgi:hypothetical protein